MSKLESKSTIHCTFVLQWPADSLKSSSLSGWFSPNEKSIRLTHIVISGETQNPACPHTPASNANRGRPLGREHTLPNTQALWTTQRSQLLSRKLASHAPFVAPRANPIVRGLIYEWTADRQSTRRCGGPFWTRRTHRCPSTERIEPKPPNPP